jgi:hypothetical protein
VLNQYGTRVISPTGMIGCESRVTNLGPTRYGSGPQSGLNYSNYQWPCWVLHCEAVRTALGTPKSTFYDPAEYSIVPSTLYWWVYLIRPYATTTASAYPHGLLWSLMRTQYSQPTWTVDGLSGLLPAVFAGIWKDIEPEPAQLAMWLVRQRHSRQPPTGYLLGAFWTYRFICEDPTIPERGPNELKLPLSAQFGDGRFEFKSGWDPDGATNTNWAVRFHMAKYLTQGNGRGPSHMNGAWEVHRKGPQTIIRGPGGHGWAGVGAFNALYFRDTQFTPFTGDADYVLRIAGSVVTGVAPGSGNRGLDIRPGSQSDYLGEVRTRFASGPADLDYVFADMSAWYPGPKWSNSDNPPSVVLCHDQKVLFRPASLNDPVRVVVYRRYQTVSTRFEPTFVWNPSGNAVSIDGTETAGTPVRNGSGGGQWTYTGASRAIVVNTVSVGTPAYNGKNVLTVIRPTSRTIVKSGGPDSQGNEFQDTAQGDGGWDHTSNNWSCEAIDLYGERFSFSAVEPGSSETAHHGRYCVQIQANPIATAGDFLVVNEVGDSSMTPSNCEHLTGTNFAGVAIHGSDGKRIAVFGTAGDAASGSFIIPTAGTYKALICNLLASTCAITGGGNIASITAIEGTGGSPFPVAGSRTVYVNIVVAANGTGPANTITLQGSGVPAPPPPDPPTGVRIIR